jgi:hypothetical protein
MTGVLAAAVRVMQQAWRRLAVAERHLKCVQRNSTFQPFAYGPSDHSTREQSRITARYNQPSKVHR